MKTLDEYLNEEIRKQLFSSVVFDNVEEYQDSVKEVVNKQKETMNKVKNIVCEFANSFIGYENINVVETIHDLKDFKQLKDKTIYFKVKYQLRSIGLGMHINREISFGKVAHKIHVYKLENKK